MKYNHEISLDSMNQVPIIKITGDLTSEADGNVKAKYGELSEKFSTEKIIINFEDTKYINSSGIATLINIIQNVNELNGIVSFVGMSEHLQKVMDIVGISDFVQIFKTNEEAVQKL